MYGFMAAGPNPSAMTCEEIERGYELNQKLAKTRSGQHRKNSLERVKELEPFYQQCISAGIPYKKPTTDTQAVLDKIFQDGGQFTQTAPISPALASAVWGTQTGTAATAVPQASVFSQAVGVVAFVVAAGVLIWIVQKGVQKRKAE